MRYEDVDAASDMQFPFFIAAGRKHRHLAAPRARLTRRSAYFSFNIFGKTANCSAVAASMCQHLRRWQLLYFHHRLQILAAAGDTPIEHALHHARAQPMPGITSNILDSRLQLTALNTTSDEHVGGVRLFSGVGEKCFSSSTLAKPRGMRL